MCSGLGLFVDLLANNKCGTVIWSRSLIVFEYPYQLKQGEVIFECLNEITRGAYFKGQVEFAMTPQEMFFVMCYKPIRFGVDGFG